MGEKLCLLKNKLCLQESKNSNARIAMSSKLEPGLYLLCTPIGNRGDITLRVLDVLENCDYIVSEDIRTAKKLLSMYKIMLAGRKIISYSDNSNAYTRKKILKNIQDGKSVALISDAGSPLISDPGYKLVSQLISDGGNLYSLPGANSVITALTLSGLPSDRFYFFGFLPTKRAKSQDELFKLSSYMCTTIIFESPKRLLVTLEMIKKVFGKEHPIAICREMTKKFEEVQRGSVSEILENFRNRLKILGEFVIVIGPRNEDQLTTQQIDEYLHYELKTKSVKDSVKFLSETLSVSKKLIYDRAIEIKMKTRT